MGSLMLLLYSPTIEAEVENIFLMFIFHCPILSEYQNSIGIVHLFQKVSYL